MFNVFDLISIDLDSTYRNRKDFPHPAQFETTFSSSALANAFNSTDPILNGYPYEIGNTTAPSAALNEIQLPATSSSTDNFYINSYVSFGGEFRLIVSYDGGTQIATVNPPFSVIPGIGPYTIRRSLPIYSNTIAAGSTTTQYVLTAGPSFDPSGYFIYMTSGALSGQVTLIKSYNALTLTATVSTLFAIPAPGDTFEILQFTRDNYCPIIANIKKNGTPYTYEATLLYLIVPNEDVYSANGGRVTDYPYVYVELRPRMNPTLFGIYSNNPNAKTATFKVPIDNESVTRKFLTLAIGRHMRQFLTFSNADSYIFSVYLPNGELLKFAPDTMSPLPPDPLKQISAVFSLRLPATDYGNKIESSK